MKFILDNLDDRVESHVQLEVLSKMQAIANNLDEMKIEGHRSLSWVGAIGVDFNSSFDEFTLQYNTDTATTLNIIEVVTPDIAEAKDRANLAKGELEMYRLGSEPFSAYRPLNDMYYYREL